MADHEGTENDRENIGPPEPVAGDAIGGDQSGDRQRGVGGKGRGDD
jgi:hypothetical protein